MRRIKKDISCPEDSTSVRRLGRVGHASLVVSLLGVRVSSYFTESAIDEEFEDEELVE